MTVRDWPDLGILPLQDHERNVDTGMRMQLVGGRVISFTDAAEAGSAEEVIPTIGAESGLGTLGDIHPWTYWQTRNRDVRATGSWAQVFAGVVISGRGGPMRGRTGGPTVPAGMLPVNGSDYGVDGRYERMVPGWSKALPRLPKGTLMAVASGMNEDEQETIALHVDPRLIAVNHREPGDAGTIVCDLDPANEICMGGGGGGNPGIDGRAARLQSMMRVIAQKRFGGGPFSNGNSLAWNLDESSQDGLAGYGLMWLRVESGGGGPITGSGGGLSSSAGPITGSGGGLSSAQSSTGGGFAGSLDDPERDGPQFGTQGSSNGSGEGLDPLHGKTPDEFGQFRKRRTAGLGLACLSNTVGGPIIGGHEEDEHRLGTDADGNPINSAHISTQALFYRSKENDGPLEFNGDYPNPGSFPLPSMVWLGWDRNTKLWRWWTRVPEMEPDSPDTPPPIDDPPPPPITGRPTTPGGPSTPGSPSQPGQPNPPPPGGGPGSGGPRSPGPRGPGGPRVPPRGPGGPTTPGPFGPYPRGAGYGWRGPGSPPFPGQPGAGPITPGHEGPRTGPPGGPSVPPPPNPPASPSGPTTPSGGGRGGGQEPDEQDGKEWDIRQASRTTQVGQASGQVGLTGSFRPGMQSGPAISFRPQVWSPGLTTGLHNPGIDAEFVRCDENERPHSVTIHSWGEQASGSARFNYTENPYVSRARGGTVNGGVFFCPPHLHPEDYFGINSVLDVREQRTTSTVLLTPNVVLGFGTPNLDGTIDDDGTVVWVDPVDPDQPLRIGVTGPDEDLVIARRRVNGERHVSIEGTTAVRIPRGTTGQRPAVPIAGDTRINSSTAPDSLEFYDGAAWQTLTSGGGGGPAFPVVPGTVTDPSVFSTLATDTGMFWPGADEVAITANGIERQRWNGASRTTTFGVDGAGNELLIVYSQDVFNWLEIGTAGLDGARIYAAGGPLGLVGDGYVAITADYSLTPGTLFGKNNVRMLADGTPPPPDDHCDIGYQGGPAVKFRVWPSGGGAPVYEIGEASARFFAGVKGAMPLDVCSDGEVVVCSTGAQKVVLQNSNGTLSLNADGTVSTSGDLTVAPATIFASKVQAPNPGSLILADQFGLPMQTMNGAGGTNTYHIPWTGTVQWVNNAGVAYLTVAEAAPALSIGVAGVTGTTSLTFNSPTAGDSLIFQQQAGAATVAVIGNGNRLIFQTDVAADFAINVNAGTQVALRADLDVLEVAVTPVVDPATKAAPLQGGGTYVNTAATYTIDKLDHHTLCDTTSAAQTVTLPPIADATGVYDVWIIDGKNEVTIAAQGAFIVGDIDPLSPTGEVRVPIGSSYYIQLLDRDSTQQIGGGFDNLTTSTTISTTPTSIDVDDTGHLVLYVNSGTLPRTVRVSGTEIDDQGVESAAIEDIVIDELSSGIAGNTVTAIYTTTKVWVGSVDVSLLSGSSINVDTYNGGGYSLVEESVEASGHLTTTTCVRAGSTLDITSWIFGFDSTTRKGALTILGQSSMTGSTVGDVFNRIAAPAAAPVVIPPNWLVGTFIEIEPDVQGGQPGWAETTIDLIGDVVVSIGAGARRSFVPIDGSTWFARNT